MVAMLAFGGTFAYFTATANQAKGTVKTGYIKLSSNDSFKLVTTDVLPGDTIIDSALELTPDYTGTEGEYVAIKVTITVKAKDTTKTVSATDLGIAFPGATSGNGWYAVADTEGMYIYGSSATTPIAMTAKTEVFSNLTLPTSVTDNFQEGSTYSDSNLMEAEITVTIVSYGIQVANLEASTALTQLKTKVGA